MSGLHLCNVVAAGAPHQVVRPQLHRHGLTIHRDRPGHPRLPLEHLVSARAQQPLRFPLPRLGTTLPPTQAGAPPRTPERHKRQGAARSRHQGDRQEQGHIEALHPPKLPLCPRWRPETDEGRTWTGPLSSVRMSSSTLRVAMGSPRACK